jgi:hypothetical protein
MKEFLGKVVRWFSSIFQFLDDKNGKFSHKRLLAIAFGAVAIRQFVINDLAGGVALIASAVVLAVVSAITQT